MTIVDRFDFASGCIAIFAGLTCILGWFSAQWIAGAGLESLFAAAIILLAFFWPGVALVIISFALYGGFLAPSILISALIAVFVAASSFFAVGCLGTSIVNKTRTLLNKYETEFAGHAANGVGASRLVVLFCALCIALVIVVPTFNNSRFSFIPLLSVAFLFLTLSFQYATTTRRKKLTPVADSHPHLQRFRDAIELTFGKSLSTRVIFSTWDGPSCAIRRRGADYIVLSIAHLSWSFEKVLPIVLHEAAHIDHGDTKIINWLRPILFSCALTYLIFYFPCTLVLFFENAFWFTMSFYEDLVSLLVMVVAWMFYLRFLKRIEIEADIRIPKEIRDRTSLTSLKGGLSELDRGTGKFHPPPFIRNKARERPEDYSGPDFFIPFLTGMLASLIGGLAVLDPAEFPPSPIGVIFNPLAISAYGLCAFIVAANNERTSDPFERKGLTSATIKFFALGSLAGLILTLSKSLAMEVIFRDFDFLVVTALLIATYIFRLLTFAISYLAFWKALQLNTLARSTKRNV